MSNRKKWRWIFSCVAIVIFVSIAVVLVLFEKHKENSNNDKDDNNIVPPQTTEIYATSFSLNLPDTIEILIDSKVKLLSGYVNITPAMAIDKLTHEITRKSGSGIDGITFNDNVITANSLGTYSMKFKVPKSESTNFSKTINIVVYEDKNSSHIYQTSNSINIGDNKNVNEIFTILDNNYQVETDNKAIISNGVINGMALGETKIKFTFTKNYVKFIYDFILTIKEQPVYNILILNGTDNIIEIDLDKNPYAKIHYEIRNGNEKHIYQDVVAVSDNENIVRVVNYPEPFINIEAVGLGETTITITFSRDTSINIQVTIIVN